MANKLLLHSMETESCIVFLRPLLQQYYSHSQQISQPALTVTSKSRTYMPVLKSRSNLYSWGIRTLMQGLLWKALTPAAIKRGYEAVLQISKSFSPNKARIKVSSGQKPVWLREYFAMYHHSETLPSPRSMWLYSHLLHFPFPPFSFYNFKGVFRLIYKAVT